MINRKTELMIKGWMFENGLNINVCGGDGIPIIQTIQRLIKRHSVQCANSCNREGVVKGQRYYAGQIDDYVKQKYGYNVKSAYINKDVTIFDSEIDKIESRLWIECRRIGLNPEFQHDPRGATVKLNRSRVTKGDGLILFDVPCTWLY